jgi:hypothetical protein
MEGDQLYGLPLDRFVPERGALARTLRAEGRREEAAEVAKLRKPSVAAWAVNQLVRTQGKAVADLFAAGDALLEAHEAVVSGAGDARALRDAATQERGAAAALVDTARGLLTSDGHELSPAILDRVADTLHAAALDESARAQVREGRLEHELRHIGLGSATFAGALPSPSRARRAKAAAQLPAEPAPDVAALRKAARTAEAQARRDAERAQRAVRDAARTREVAGEQVRACEEALAQAREALAEAEGRLAEAEAEADAAAEAHRRASAELERVDGRARADD